MRWHHRWARDRRRPITVDLPQVSHEAMPDFLRKVFKQKMEVGLLKRFFQQSRRNPTFLSFHVSPQALVNLFFNGGSRSEIKFNHDTLIFISAMWKLWPQLQILWGSAEPDPWPGLREPPPRSFLSYNLVIFYSLSHLFLLPNMQFMNRT